MLTPLIGSTLVAVLLTWGLAAGITLWVYAAVSLADFGDLLAAAARASAPAMWFPPAMLLVTAPQAGARLAGVLLVANTVRLLFSPRPGKRLRAGLPATRRASVPFSLYTGRQPLLFWRQTLPPVLGALAFQAGLYAFSVDCPRLAAACFATGAAIWTRCSIGRGAYQPRRKPDMLHSALAILLTLLLATSLSIGQFAMDERFADSTGLLETARRVFGPLPPASKPKLETAKQSATPVFTPTREVGRSGGKGVPGVVLRPEANPLLRTRLWFPAAVTAFTISRPLTIPFTGEYHLYRTSSGSLPPGASIYVGTPLDAIYITTNNTPMETEAYQRFEPPIDFGNCDAIQVALLTAEVFPVSASMRLQTAGGTEDLGTQIFGLTPAREQTVEFALPAPPRRLRVSAIRVVFHRNPAELDQSTRVAIQGFTLVPRGFTSQM